MTFTDVWAHFDIDNRYSSNELTQIRKALLGAYQDSPTAEAMLNKLAASALTIKFRKDDDFSAHPDDNSLHFEDDYLDTFKYVDNSGKLTSFPFQLALLHELAHLINGTVDYTPTQLAQHDYFGPTVGTENIIRAELGKGFRPSYFNTISNDSLDGLPLAFKRAHSYTNGEEMNLVVVTNYVTGPDIDSSSLGASRDLLIGGGRFDNVLKSGDGDDFLYGFYNNDKLDGGKGNDFLFGGEGRDILTGGAGNNTLVGGGDKDVAELSGFKYANTVSGGGDKRTYTNQATGEKNVLLGVETVRFTATDQSLPNDITSAFVGTSSSTTIGRNDDGYEEASLLTAFAKGFNFFGVTYTSVFVNNNGNLTFGTGLSGYTPGTIGGTSGLPIIAAFWADVDTRGSTGTVSYGYNADHDSFVATWLNVDYYNVTQSGHAVKSNSYQIEIFDQGAGDAEIIIRYGGISWTTGDASGGSGGLGGSIARAGINSGSNGAFYKEIDGSGTDDMLMLNSMTNCGRAGVYRYSVHNGTIIEDERRSANIDASDLDWAFI